MVHFVMTALAVVVPRPGEAMRNPGSAISMTSVAQRKRVTSSLVPLGSPPTRTSRHITQASGPVVPARAVTIRETGGRERPRKALRLQDWFSNDARDAERLAWLHREWLAARGSAVVAAYTADSRHRPGLLFDLAA